MSLHLPGDFAIDFFVAFLFLLFAAFDALNWRLFSSLSNRLSSTCLFVCDVAEPLSLFGVVVFNLLAHLGLEIFGRNFVRYVQALKNVFESRNSLDDDLILAVGNILSKKKDVR